MEAVIAHLFWLSDEQWAVMAPFMPKDQPRAEWRNARQIISGILHVLTSGCRWRNCPATYGPRTAIYNRWSRRCFWQVMLAALAKAGWSGEAAAIDNTYVRAHRSAQGGKGGRRPWPSGRLAAGRQPRSMRSPMSSAGPACSC